MISVITIALGCLSQNQGPLAHSSRKHVPYPDGLQAGEIWMITSGWQMGNWAKGSSWLAQGHGGATWVPWLSCHLEPRGWAGAVRTFQCELRDIHVAPITDPGPWFHFLNWRQQQDAGIFRLCSLQGMFLLKKKKKSVSLWDVKSQKDESFVETSPNFDFLPPLLGQCSLDFNILLVLKCSHGFWGHLALAQWVFSGCLGASQHTAPGCSLLLPHLTNHLQGLLKSRSASLPISQAVPPLHMLQVPSQSCPSPLKPGAFLADRTWAENTWVQVPRKMPPVKNDVRGRRFWSFPDGWW